jgi:hypothetical protein
MRQPISAMLTVAALLAGLAGCSEPASSPDESAPPSFVKEAPAAPDDYVPTPAGWYHRSCVHGVENGAKVGKDGEVTRKNGSKYRIPGCAHPVRASKDGPALPPAIDRSAPAMDRAAPPPTITGWVEYASRLQPAGSWYKQITANWTVPVSPLAYYVSSQLVYYTFPGLQQTYIIQPVLQYGGGGNSWVMASWHCNSSLGCVHSPFTNTVAGHALFGSVVSSNCVGANCTWTITTRDVTSNVQTVLTKTDTYNYQWGVGGSVEVYNLTSCDQFPIRGVFYSNIKLYDQNNVLLSPNWSRTQPVNPSPSCSFGVTSAPTTVNLFHNPATVTAIGGLTASCSSSTPLCTSAWLTSVTASGNTITWRDNGGHTGVTTLTGATASGGFTARCTAIFCTTFGITSISASGNTITVSGTGGSGAITLTGATAAGSVVGSCGITCSSHPWIGSVIADGSNGLKIVGGVNRGYIRFN